MNLYRYVEYRTEKEIFRAEADSITEADQLLLKATGINAEKAPYIGCFIQADGDRQGE